MYDVWGRYEIKHTNCNKYSTGLQKEILQFKRNISLCEVSYSQLLQKIMYKTMMTKEHRIFLPKEFVLILSDEWKKTFTLQDTLEEYIMLDFMIFKYEENEDLTFYAKELNKLFQKLSNIFGDLIMPLVSQFLSDNLKYLLTDVYFELKLMELLSIILKYNSSLSTCLLVVQLLPRRYNDEVNPNFDYIMEVVKDKGELVQIYLNTYFKNQQYH
ncbi:hypothetical protein HHI36_009435 [Cryptolaemus montrouzieri]|uniref:Uncharacterized protein n=1 Tax=Cryptolaemus montrouzieri TaxID=559131 RepID=A0ABD2MFC2_9CUCU